MELSYQPSIDEQAKQESVYLIWSIEIAKAQLQHITKQTQYWGEPKQQTVVDSRCLQSQEAVQCDEQKEFFGQIVDDAEIVEE